MEWELEIKDSDLYRRTGNRQRKLLPPMTNRDKYDIIAISKTNKLGQITALYVRL